MWYEPVAGIAQQFLSMAQLSQILDQDILRNPALVAGFS